MLGHPNQGKTTASYLAAQGGLTYYADQAVFLEIGSSGLQAWGDLFRLHFALRHFISYLNLRL